MVCFEYLLRLRFLFPSMNRKRTTVKYDSFTQQFYLSFFYFVNSIFQLFIVNIIELYYTLLANW